jgi:hypothetical protein
MIALIRISRSEFMKKALAITLAILLGLLLSTAVRAETLKKNLVPADASWVIHLDLEQLLSSRFFNQIMGTEGWDKVEEKNATFEKKFRINLLKDIKGVTVYGKGHDEESAVACISGRLDKDHLLRLLGMDEAHIEIPYGSFTMHNWDGEAFGAFVGNDLAVITKGEDILKHALDVISGKAADITNSEAASLIGRAPADSFVTAVARNISDLLGDEQDDHSAILKKAESALLHVAERGDDLFLGAEMSVTSPKDAENIEQMLKGLLAMVDMYKDNIPAGIKIPEDIKISRAGNYVRVEMSYPTAEAIKLIAEKGHFPFRFVAGVFPPFLP